MMVRPKNERIKPAHRLWLALLLLLAPVHAACAETALPWMADVSYGSNPLNKLDIYRPAGVKDDLPFVMYIHGGGWWNGDKAYLSKTDVEFFTSRRIVLVAINYRNLPAAQQDHLFPPVLGPLEDAEHALQFLRYHAKSFALDPAKAALWGDSAGAFDALWLGLAPNRADPSSPDPMQRLSTRVSAIGVTDAQTSIDPRQMRDWVGLRLHYGGHAFGLPEADFDQFLARRAEFARYFPSLSPAAIINPSSPPLYLLYTSVLNVRSTEPMYYVHSPDFGLHFAELARRKNVPVTLKISADPEARVELARFLAASLTH